MFDAVYFCTAPNISLSKQLNTYISPLTYIIIVGHASDKKGMNDQSNWFVYWYSYLLSITWWSQKKIDWFYNIDNKNNKTSQQRKIKDKEGHTLEN